MTRLPRPGPAARRRYRRRLVWRTVAATLAASALLAGLAGVLAVRLGWYDAGAIDQHWQPVHQAIELGLRYSARHHARNIPVPALTPDMAQRGAAVYGAHCVQCHGAPGVAPAQATLALQPAPGPLVNMRQRWEHNELYWLISNGVKMTGMPAWQYRLSQQDRWSLVAFLDRLPLLTPEQGARLLGPASAGGAGPAGATGAGLVPVQQPAPAPPGRPADAARGRVALTQYACNSCHVIAGVTGPAVEVGPPLKDLAGRRYVAGYLPMTQDNLARWIRFPTDIKPGTAMPSLQVTERDARDMASWLLSEQAR